METATNQEGKMVVTFGLPGTSRFRWTRCVKADADKWRAAQLEELGETQETLQAYREYLLLNEKEAKKMRWQDGRRIFEDDGEPTRFYRMVK